MLAGALAGILRGRRARPGSAARWRARCGWRCRFALLVTIVNALVYQEGDTLLVRGGEFLGRRWDITLEATVEGAMMGLRIVVLIVALGG